MTKPKFLSNDRAIRDGFTIHQKDQEVIDVTSATAASNLPDDMAQMLKVGGFLPPPCLEEHGAALSLYLEIMLAAMRQIVAHNPEAAPAITRWRIELRYSWRLVAQAVSEEIGAPWTPPWNQIGGIGACMAAAEKAGSDPMESPWN